MVRPGWLLLMVVAVVTGCRGVDVDVGTRRPHAGADAGSADALAADVSRADVVVTVDSGNARDAPAGDAARPVDAPPGDGQGPALACPAEPAAAPQPFFEAPYIAIGNLAVDDRHLYLKASDCCEDPPGFTVRVPLGGGPPEVIHSSTRYHTGLALDDARVSFAAEEGLKTFDKATGGIAVIPGAIYSSVARFAGRIYAASPGRLVSYGADGAVTATVEGGFDADALWVDGAGIAFTNRGAAGRLMTLAPGAATPSALVTGTGAGGDLAADAQYYYWQDPSGVFRTPRAGGPTMVLLGPGLAPAGVALGGGTLYITTAGRICARATGGAGMSGGALYRMPAEGGPLVELASDLVAPSKVTVDASHVYWVSGSNQNHYRSVRRLAR